MNMYIHELKRYRKSTITWTISLVLITVLFFSMFPAFSENAGQMQEMFKGFPDEVLKALGLSTLDLSSILGFYAYIFSYVVLCGAIQAMNLGLSSVSVEVREKTSDFLLAKPITRNEIITSKLLAIITSVLITNIFYFSTAFFMAMMLSKDSFSIKIFILISLSLFLVEIIFLALGMLISVLVKKIKSVVPISLGIVFSFYIINLFGSAIGDDKFKYVTPFKFFEPEYIINNGNYEMKFVLIEIIFVAVSVFLSYKIYRKKDINAF
ncbi:MAG: ABC transporter permease subunit [Clostridiaceae bacterium]